jgi:S-adenosylmethionine synthetase
LYTHFYLLLTTTELYKTTLEKFQFETHINLSKNKPKTYKKGEDISKMFLKEGKSFRIIWNLHLIIQEMKIETYKKIKRTLVNVSQS